MVAGLVLVAWYLGVLLLYLDSVAANPELIFGITLSESARATIAWWGNSWLWLSTSILAVDVMSDLPLPDETRLRMVTLGSPAELLARKATWLEQEIDACAGRAELEEWVDVVSRADWLASGTTPKSYPATREVTVRPHGTLLDRVAARVHGRYFDSQQAINEIAA